jgi:endoglucanase
MTAPLALAAVELRPEIPAGRYVALLSPSPTWAHNTTQLGITTGVYTAAGSQALFDTDGATWCGGGCGKCYNLTSTGSAPCSTCGNGEAAGASIIVMVTDLCPFNGNEQWCPAVGGDNKYGYSYHFDIMAESEVFGDNPVVEFEPVACPGQATTDWEQCVCFEQIATDETPAGLSAG